MKLSAVPKEGATHFAVRLTGQEVPVWESVFPKTKVLFYLVGFEGNSLGQPAYHSHSAVILEHKMKRDTFINYMKRQMPWVKGNEVFSCKHWDDHDKYLRYCVKERSSWHPPVMYGSRLKPDGQAYTLADVPRMIAEFWSINDKLKKAKTPAIEEWLDEQIQKQEDFRLNQYIARSDYSNGYQKCSRQLILELIAKYFRITNTEYHGNDFQFRSFVNRYEMKVFKLSDAYIEEWIKRFL